MRVIAFLVVALMSVASFPVEATPIRAQEEDLLDCADFGTQEEAQDELEFDPSDPFLLDADGDGLACNSETDTAATGGRDNGGTDVATQGDPPVEEVFPLEETGEEEPAAAQQGGGGGCARYPDQAAAQAALNADPSLATRLDRNGDGVACETFFADQAPPVPDAVPEAAPAAPAPPRTANATASVRGENVRLRAMPVADTGTLLVLQRGDVVTITGAAVLPDGSSEIVTIDSLVSPDLDVFVPVEGPDGTSGWLIELFVDPAGFIAGPTSVGNNGGSADQAAPAPETEPARQGEAEDRPRRRNQETPPETPPVTPDEPAPTPQAEQGGPGFPRQGRQQRAWSFNLSEARREAEFVVANVFVRNESSEPADLPLEDMLLTNGSETYRSVGMVGPDGTYETGFGAAFVAPILPAGQGLQFEILFRIPDGVPVEGMRFRIER